MDAGTTYLTLTVLVLANRALVDCLAEGSIFSSWRSWWQRRSLFLGELWSCRFCLTFHAAFWLVLLEWSVGPYPAAWAELGRRVLLWLAVAGGAILVQRVSDYFRDPERDAEYRALEGALAEVDDDDEYDEYDPPSSL